MKMKAEPIKVYAMHVKQTLHGIFKNLIKNVFIEV